MERAKAKEKNTKIFMCAVEKQIFNYQEQCKKFTPRSVVSWNLLIANVLVKRQITAEYELEQYLLSKISVKIVLI